MGLSFFDDLESFDFEPFSGPLEKETFLVSLETVYLGIDDVFFIAGASGPNVGGGIL